MFNCIVVYLMLLFNTAPKTRFILLLLLCTPFLFNACKQKEKLVKIDPAFSKYIDAYTSGVVSKKAVITLKLASGVVLAHSINEPVKEELFSFSPAVKGVATWIDHRTIQFKASEDFEPDQLYTVSFHLNKLIDLPKAFSRFQFNIQIIKPAYQVEDEGLISYGKDSMSLSGKLITSDIEKPEAIEKIISASYGASPVQIKWMHNEATRTHQYTVAGIKRKNKEQKLAVKWSGDPINATYTGNKEIAIPAIGDFKVLNMRVVQQEEQYALIQFSDPLKSVQVLEGLMGINQVEGLSYTISRNEVKLYNSGQMEGDHTVYINEGIQNEWGDKLRKAVTGNLFYENRLPSVQMKGQGVFLPNSGGKVIMPFEATNLTAVDISIVRIYESNVPAFLQYNQINGGNELRRVGAPVAEATLRLDTDPSVDLHKKNRFLLDLDQYIKTDPGAIYRVKIAFRPSYSIYACPEKMKDEGRKDFDEDSYYYDDLDDDKEFWYRYDEYYPYGYDWNERQDPCKKAFYNGDRFVSRNVIATNLGVIAKRNTDNSFFVAVHNLINTESVDNATVSLLDYQQQVVGKANTGSDGTAMIVAKRKPFLLVAQKGNEKTYLRIDDGTNLPLSKFDVSGVEVKNGIRGFIFGERGVWRPGDSLFLSCMIYDKKESLPEGHPVELELFTPQGQLYKKIIQPYSPKGLHVFRVTTDAGAPTGGWNCKVKVGGAVFTKRIKVETIMPNRLKLDLQFGAQPYLSKANPVAGTLSAKWLFGATANQLKARVDAQFYKNNTPFPAYAGYAFEDPTTIFSPQSTTLFDGKLNSDGKAAVSSAFNMEETAPGLLTANLTVKVFEPGGNFSIDNFSLPYHPYTSYTGIKAPKGNEYTGVLDAGKTHQFELVDLDNNGIPVRGTSEIELRLYKLQWRWWWDDASADLKNFSQDSYNKPVNNTSISLENGKGNYPLHFKKGENGRFLLLVKDKKSGHTSGKVFHVTDDRMPNIDAMENGAITMLSFTSDKEKYQAGEQVHIAIPSAEAGKAIISIENGSQVLKTYQVKTQKGKTNFSFTATEDMAPNVYVHVTLVQPHAQTVNDLPIRMYGVIPVLIEDRSTMLKPLIRVKDVIKPEETNSITVTEANGKPMNYVIAIVDEGLLDLTRYKTPDPHQSFFAKEALGVKSWDIYDYVIGAWGGELQRILTIGGDADGELASKTRRANRFKPVVKFMGPFSSNGKASTHQFTLPPYMGAARVMVIASDKNRFGMTEKSIQVKKSLMILATMPRVLGPAEEITIPVTVFATSKNIKDVRLQMEANPYIEAAGQQQLSFTSMGEQVALFTARVKNKTGIGKVSITAQSGNEKDKQEIEIDIRNPNPLITQTKELTIQPGKTWSDVVEAIGDGLTSSSTLELSAIPSIQLQKHLNYLIQYPHGCIEQTTSAVFPQLFLDQLMELSDQRKKEIRVNIQTAIQKIQNFQTGTGGFGYWPGDIDDEWGTNYAGHFLLEAISKGYQVPASVMQQWSSYLRKKANGWNIVQAPSYGSDLTQAYRLYLLALNKAPEIGAMNKLKEYKFIQPETKWRLAAAYQLIGQPKVALELIAGLPTRFEKRNEWGISYGSSLRDEAMVLETLTLLNRRTMADQLVRSIAASLSNDSWYSTQTTAYSLLAIAKYSGHNSSKDIKIQALVKNHEQSTNINSSSVISQVQLGRKSGKAGFTINNKGKNVLYARIINTGQPFSTDIIAPVNNANILSVATHYMNTAGETINPTLIKQGTDFVAKVTIRNPGKRGHYAQMALSQLFPSGWEILNTRLFDNEGIFKSSVSDYMDIRDDRVYHYFSLKAGESKTFYVQLNAAYLGKFFWPGVYCEAMYDKTISAGTGAKWVTVE